jgi:anti-sigma factor RsiW
MKQRDLELLSSYLDGQLSSSEATRLEARLRTEPDLRSVLQDLRGARTVLRQLPMRKAPRNFRLTPKMVGKNPPLPRAYPVFRFASTLATLLLFFTFGLNVIGPQLASQPPVFGMGGGGPDTFAAEAASQAVSEAPLAEMPASEAPAEEPSVAMAPMPTASVSAEEAARAAETETTQSDAGENAAGDTALVPPETPAEKTITPSISPVWQWILAGVALASALIMALMRQLAFNRWRNKK